MTASEAIRNALAVLDEPSVTPEQVAAHWSMTAAVRAADERKREPSPQLELGEGERA